MYFVKTPNIIKPLYRDLIWKLPDGADKVVYLTFDDGPTPSITDKTLSLLADFDARATFFLVGQNVAKHPEYLNTYRKQGHSIGNHSFSHLNGWQTDTQKYLKDVSKAKAHIKSHLFRPPYGKIKRDQSKRLREQGYQIVMWDVLSGDFDPSVSVERCVHNVVNNVENGSIVVLHDSVKASKTMLDALPAILEDLSAQGFRFEAIPES